MTNTHDKEWIELNNSSTVKTYKLKGVYVDIPQSLLDQIRRDTVDDFLKWLGEQDLYFTNSKIRMPSDIRHQYLERAKTLGEK